MKWELGAFATMTFALAAACAVTPEGADQPARPILVSSEIPNPTNRFLAPEETPDMTKILPTPAAEGSALNNSDWAVFRATRSLKDTERWAMALNDDDYSEAAVMADYSCAVGVKLTPVNAPLTSRLVAMASTDSAIASDLAKTVYQRKRPFLSNDGDICLERSERLAASFDYPSGHASASWMAGLVMAQLAPDRSSEVLARARAYGESRVVCGVHNYSSIVAGRTVGASVFSALQSDQEFTEAVQKARAELSSVRKAGEAPDAATCAREAQLVAPLDLSAAR